MIRVLFFFLFCSLNAQRVEPMRDCFCDTHSSSNTIRKYYNPNYSLSVSSKNSKVFSLSDGIVSKIIKNGNSNSIIIKSDSLFFIYSNIVNIPKKIALQQLIKKKEIIGKGNGSNKNYSIEIQIYKGIELLPDITEYIKCSYYSK